MKKLLAATLVTVSIGAAGATAFAAGSSADDPTLGSDTSTTATAESGATESDSAEGCDRPAGRRHRVLRAAFHAAAEAIGITPEELRDELADGGSIAAVAEAHDVDPADVEAAMLADLSERIATAVEKGRIEPERAAEILDKAAERIHEFVTKERTAHA